MKKKKLNKMHKQLIDAGWDEDTHGPLPGKEPTFFDWAVVSIFFGGMLIWIITNIIIDLYGK